MTVKRAWGEAMAVVAISMSIVFWFLGFRARLRFEEWPLFFIVALPQALLLMLWIFARPWEKRPADSKLSRRQHILLALCAACVATVFLIVLLPRAQTGSDRSLQLVLLIGWYVIAAVHIRRALNAESTSSVATQ